MAKFKIFLTNNCRTRHLIGEYDCKYNAIDEATDYAKRHIGWMSHDETDMCKESLESRGFYCVGCSSALIEIVEE